METCPDCTYVEEQVKGNDKYEVIDIGRNVRDLKAFLRMRDGNDVFAQPKRVGCRRHSLFCVGRRHGNAYSRRGRLAFASGSFGCGLQYRR